MKTGSVPPLPEIRDLSLIQQCNIYELLLEALNRDLQSLHGLELKMGALYLRGLESVKERVQNLEQQIRQDMKRRGIRITEQQRSNQGVHVSYLCRGYHDRFTLSWTEARSEACQELARQIGVDLSLADVETAPPLRPTPLIPTDIGIQRPAPNRTARAEISRKNSASSSVSG
ncbi:hypothetical protein Q5741_02165 [Paenibacillus sp. JX-17]|uniref:Uncharacterized protein n=1 Tax=Paenibacillus lacisoli TaxID=3064525 RepID=A0ABT9CC85_9BACL|nr:hypothetical protein [Paenibacillus sp. JX-17]MDO7905218.1 hypothetical protein [Paenibacillus sp. JX-17]